MSSLKRFTAEMDPSKLTEENLTDSKEDTCNRRNGSNKRIINTNRNTVEDVSSNDIPIMEMKFKDKYDESTSMQYLLAQANKALDKMNEIWSKNESISKEEEAQWLDIIQTIRGVINEIKTRMVNSTDTNLEGREEDAKGIQIDKWKCTSDRWVEVYRDEGKRIHTDTEKVIEEESNAKRVRMEAEKLVKNGWIHMDNKERIKNLTTGKTVEIMVIYNKNKKQNKRGKPATRKIIRINDGTVKERNRELYKRSKVKNMEGWIRKWIKEEEQNIDWKDDRYDVRKRVREKTRRGTGWKT